jgi:pimeloyl-ACP methyl ester carboxylesterase
VSGGPRWRTLPPTPTLPAAARSGSAPLNGVDIWYAVFGHGEPVILLHGGLANANYWGHQVPALAIRHQVVVMDSRGHGRSSRDERPLGYHLMAADVIALLDFLAIEKAAVIGWSDGANLGLDLAIHRPDRLTGLFAFAGNADPSGVADHAPSTVFDAYLARVATEYEGLSPTPDEYVSFLDQITTMWATQPNFTAEALHGITVPTWVVGAEHDESVSREHTVFMADQIRDAALLIQPGVSHFSLLQDPRQFNEDVLRFLDRAGSNR